jgi:hypothetical protein
MPPVAARALRERLGEQGTEELAEFVRHSGHQWRDEVMNLAAARFEQRLSEESARLRVEMAGLRADLRQDVASLRVDLVNELSAGRVEIIRWSFLFWIGQTGALAVLMWWTAAIASR